MNNLIDIIETIGVCAWLATPLAIEVALLIFSEKGGAE